MHPSVIVFSVCLAMLSDGFSSAGETAPNNLRISLQLIDVTHPVLTEMMSGKETSGAVLHTEAMALVKAGEAKVVESNVVLTRSGQKATLETYREIMYPSESMISFGGCGLGGPLPASPKPARHLRFLPPCFETRNAGGIFEVEPTLSVNELIIDIRLTHEVVAPIREVSWLQYGPEWGSTPIRTPIFEVWRTNTNVSIMAGQFELVSVITPKSAAPVPAVLRKVLVFVRADVMPVVHSP